jgi:hypothetical protein
MQALKTPSSSKNACFNVENVLDSIEFNGPLMTSAEKLLPLIAVKMCRKRG